MNSIKDIQVSVQAFGGKKYHLTLRNEDVFKFPNSIFENNDTAKVCCFRAKVMNCSKTL